MCNYTVSASFWSRSRDMFIVFADVVFFALMGSGLFMATRWVERTVRKR